jgi:hypothetical protein
MKFVADRPFADPDDAARIADERALHPRRRQRYATLPGPWQHALLFAPLEQLAPAPRRLDGRL